MTYPSKVKELSNLLVKGFHWMDSHPDEVEKNMELMQRALPIFRKLRRQGIPMRSCWDALLLGLPINEKEI